MFLKNNYHHITHQLTPQRIATSRAMIQKVTVLWTSSAHTAAMSKTARNAAHSQRPRRARITGPLTAITSCQFTKK